MKEHRQKHSSQHCPYEAAGAMQSNLRKENGNG